VAFLTDRSPAETLPTLLSLGLDVKTEPLAPSSFEHASALGPSAILVDAVADPEAAFGVLSEQRSTAPQFAVVVVVAPANLDQWPWAEVADDLLDPGASATEIRVRLAMLARRTGGAGETVLRLGPLSVDVESYRVTVAGRVLDLTYKEFELLRFLVQHPDRVFTRSDLLMEVWGFNFYGGTRTVDVHVRRLRAKLGPEHEALIGTVRGVGYRAAVPDPQVD
jgi:DNA-binding response OmpR family regulator